MTSLVESRAWRFTALAVLYLAQGLPFGLFGVAIPSWMAGQGYSAAAIGSFVGVVWLPWSLKILVAPLMDRFTFLPMGHRRPWVMAAQLGIIGSFILIMLVPAELMWLTVLAVVSNTFAATQDVAVDGMAIDILPDSDRARANGFMFGGQYLGIALGTSGGGYALKFLGLDGVGALGIAVMIVVFAVPLALRERPGEKLLPWTAGQAHSRLEVPANAREQFRQTLVALAVPVSLLLLLILFGFRCAEGLLLTLLPVFTVQTLGWESVDYNDMVTLGGLSAAVAGVMLSPLIDRFGVGRTFWFIGLGKLLLMALTPLLMGSWSAPLIVLHLIMSQLVTITLIALFMRICVPQVAATQFSIYMAASNLSYSGGAFAFGLISLHLSPAQILSLALMLIVMALVLWFFALRLGFSRPPAPVQVAETV